MTSSLSRKATIVALTASMLGATAFADSETITATDVITGKMSIDFQTRQSSNQDSAGKPVKGVADTYKIDPSSALTLNLGKGAYKFYGEVKRFPYVDGGFMGLGDLVGAGQQAGFNYQLPIEVSGKVIGTMVGAMAIDKEGIYHLGDSVGTLRNAITAGKLPGEFAYGGLLRGKGSASKTTNQIYELWGMVKGQKTKVQRAATNLDPMRFENLRLGSGPSAVYSEATVNGSLDYDYESGNYYAKDLKISYMVDGVAVNDVISGNIYWNDDKGQYEFNLQYNAASVVAASGDEFADFEVAAGSEDDEFASFEADSAIPAITGTIKYDDQTGYDGKGEEVTTASDVTYNLNATKLTKQQIMNFMKLWLIAIGPTNDD